MPKEPKSFDKRRSLRYQEMQRPIRTPMDKLIRAYELGGEDEFNARFDEVFKTHRQATPRTAAPPKG